MIRVNLLPIKQARRRSQGRVQVFLFIALIIIELVILFAIYAVVNEQLSAREADVNELKQEVSGLERDVAGAEELEAEAVRLREQLAVLSDLEARRIGPVRMLDEVQAMLSPYRNEEDRVNQLRRDWNVDWDTRRLWVESFSESEGEFSLNGFAGTADDVAEFLQRMTTAFYFNDVQLDVVERTGSGSESLVSFRIYGDLDYTGFDEDEEGS